MANDYEPWVSNKEIQELTIRVVVNRYLLMLLKHTAMPTLGFMLV